MKALTWAALAAVTLWLPGCPPVGISRTAKTLEPGEQELGGGVGHTLYFHAPVDWYDGTDVRQKREAATDQASSPAPDVHYRRGLRSGLDAGARVGLGSGLVEADARWRFVHTGGLHVALDPAVQATLWGGWSGWRATLPVMATYEIGSALVSLGVHGGWYGVDNVQLKPEVLGQLQPATTWSIGKSGPVWGGTAGFEWRPRDQGTSEWFAGLMLDATAHKGEIGAQGKLSEYDVWAVRAMVTGGITFGRELYELRKASEKLEQVQ
jgi:hypothetical protein